MNYFPSRVCMLSFTAIVSVCFTSVVSAADSSLFPEQIAQMNQATQVAAARFLPDANDDLGFNGRVINIDIGTSDGFKPKDQCSDYNFTKDGTDGTTACASPKSLVSPCSFNSRKFLNCRCDTSTYKFTSSNCVSPVSPGSLLGGTNCSDGTTNAYSSCGCTSSSFPYTSNGSCGNDKELDTSSYCYTATDSTKRYDKCVCKSEFNQPSLLSSSQGWSCSSCNDGTNKYKCVATGCPTGTSVAPTCLANEVMEDTSSMSGGLKCKQCKVTAVTGCSQDNYQNLDGTYNVTADQCEINLYGQHNTTNIPAAGHTVWRAGWTYPSGATVNGGPLGVNNIIFIGIHGDQTTSKVTFNVPVVLFGTMELFQDSTVTFNKGLGGDFKCLRVRGSTKTPIDCPKLCNQNNYQNIDGAYTVSSSHCNIDLYGQYNTTTLPSGGISVDRAAWAFPSGATINGGALTTNQIVIGIHSGGITASATFNVPVTVYGRIILFENSSVTFNKGIKGIYKCYRYQGTSQKEIPCPF